MQTVGLVLAGGQGRRFGGAKGQHVHEGQSLARRAAGILASTVDEVLVSVGDGVSLPDVQSCLVVDEPPAGRGPLAGLHAAWQAVPECGLLVLACDYPFVTVELMAALFAARTDVSAEVDIVLAADEKGRSHPLVAWWGPQSAGKVGRALSRDAFRVMTVVDACRVHKLDASPYAVAQGVLRNVNRPTDWPAG